MPTPGFRFELDEEQLDALVRSSEVGDIVALAAQDIAQAAAALAPGSGRVAATYQATAPEEASTGMIAHAFTDHEAGSLVEFGSANNPAYAPLRRGAEATSGIRLELTPKGSTTA